MATMSRRLLLAVAAISAAALLLESTLTRLLAVAQFYHFAFLVVSLALLGFGASGTLLSLLPRLRRLPPQRLLALSGAGFAASTAVAYAVVNFVPFDSYSIAWDRRQLLTFALYYLALVTPFICAGLGIGGALAAPTGRSHLVYAANLLGSGAGVILGLAALALAGVPGAVLASMVMALAPAAMYRPRAADDAPQPRGSVIPPRERDVSLWGIRAARLAASAGLAALVVLSALNLAGRMPLGMSISPYKGLAHARRYPGATSIFGRWSTISRVDVIAGAGTHLLPGLSYAYPGLPPPQLGLSVDADSVEPITLASSATFEAAAYLPEAVAFQLRPGARALVLEPGGGLGLLQALVGGARAVTAVAGDPLVRLAVQRSAASVDPYSDPRVQVVFAPDRAFLRGGSNRYAIVFLPLTDAYRPVSSGAYSLSESYLLTAEAFEDALARLEPDGLLVATRWLQTPPSEDLRLVATVAEALRRRGIRDPAQALVAFRGIQTITVLALPMGWTSGELEQVRRFAASRRYDLTWAPDIRPGEVNRYNRMPTAELFEALRAMLGAADPKAFYSAYPFDVAPATDDRPFFFHFFRWAQTPEVIATLGRTWQPFGGSGYLVLVALLILVMSMSVALILAPLAARGRVLGAAPAVVKIRAFAYFGLLGMAFLFVEIPLIQRWILPLGYPTYAFAAVVLVLLVLSGVGSALAGSCHRLGRSAPGILALLVAASAAGGQLIVHQALGWPLSGRLVLAAISLAPLGLMMGMPFPVGLAWLEAEAPGLIPWAWAVNGCASVIASVLAAMLALSYGFSAVLCAGAAAYLGAWVVLGGSGARS